jgi:hypothetical protein
MRTKFFSQDVLVLTLGKIIEKQCPWSGLNSTVEDWVGKFTIMICTFGQLLLFEK